MADIEKLRINLSKNEEKLVKKVALLAKYEDKKTKLSAQWEKIYHESFIDSMNKIYCLEEENLSTYGKIIKYYGEKGYDIYDKLYSLTNEKDYWNPINQTKKGIDELEERCQKYRNSIAEEEKKIVDRQANIASHSISINGRDVNVIIEFLNNWEVKVVEHFLRIFDRYVAEADTWYKENVKNSLEYKVYYSYMATYDELENLWKNSKYVEYYPMYSDYCRAGYNNECRKNIRSVIKAMNEKYEAIFSPKVIEKYAKKLHNPDRKVFEDNMRKAVAKEKDRKYDQLIDDVEHLVGKIIDMSHIRVGHKGDLEGYVVGNEGEAELWTTGCGGFNENVVVNVKHGQCFHFRFYVRKRI